MVLTNLFFYFFHISFLRVVISNLFLFKIAVTVPCEIPVSITLISSLLSIFLTSSGSRDVAKSISSTFSPQSAFLTHPPTNLALLSSPISLRYEKIILASFIFSNIRNAIYAQKAIRSKYPKYWCVVSKTI